MLKKLLFTGLLLLSSTVFASQDTNQNTLQKYPPEVQEVAQDYLSQFDKSVTPENIKNYIDNNPQGAKTFVFMLALRKASPIGYMLATEKLNLVGIQYTEKNFKAYLDSEEFKKDYQLVTKGLSPK